MAKIIKRERRNWFYSYNMIFDLPLSEHAKIVYIYLCRCADEEGQCFPSQTRIGEKCGISRQTVINAIKELQEIGLLDKETRTREDGGQSSNLYVIFDELTPVKEVDTPCLGDRHPPVKEVDTPCLGDRHEGLPIEGLPILKDYPSNNSRKNLAAAAAKTESEKSKEGIEEITTYAQKMGFVDLQPEFLKLLIQEAGGVEGAKRAVQDVTIYLSSGAKIKKSVEAALLHSAKNILPTKGRYNGEKSKQSASNLEEKYIDLYET